jgi:hypothetical protein
MRRQTILVVVVTLLLALAGVSGAGAQTTPDAPLTPLYLPVVGTGDDVVSVIEIEGQVGAAAVLDGQSLTLAGGEQVTAACPGGTLRVSRPASAGVRDTSRAILRCVVAATPTNTPIATATVATNTPTAIAPTATPTTVPTTPDGALGAPDWLASTAMRDELGMAPATYSKLVADAGSGQFDRACAESEHDTTRWHTLLNYADDDLPGGPCHFDHHHGDNPHAVNDIFGTPGAWFMRTGQSISYPWQTYPAQRASDPPGMYPGLLENEYKHEGYMWVVRRNQACSGGACVTDFRLQHHFHGNLDGGVGMHSASFEGRVCDDASRPETCGIVRTGGWLDYGHLIAPRSNEDCFTARQNRFPEIWIPVASDNLPYRQLDQDAPFDESRCHKVLSAQEVAAGPIQFRSSGPAVGPAEWWSHGASDFRFQFVMFDPVGNVNQDGSFTQFCGINDVNCRWRHSQFTARIQYILPLNSYYFPEYGGQRRVDLQLGQRFLNRFGGINANCSMATVGMDCIPIEYSNITLRTAIGQGLTGFVQQPCNSCRSLNHDITPANRPSWVTYVFDHHR